MEEPPFLSGRMSAELAQQRMKQTTTFFVSQLMSMPEFHEVVARRPTRPRTYAWWRITLHLLGLVGAIILSLGALQYCARIQDSEYYAQKVVSRVEAGDAIASTGVEPFWQTGLPSDAIHSMGVEAFSQTGLPIDGLASVEFEDDNQEGQPTPAPSSPPSDDLSQAATRLPPSTNETSLQAVCRSDLQTQGEQASEASTQTPASACALDMLFKCNEHFAVRKLPSLVVVADVPADLPTDLLDELLAEPSPSCATRPPVSNAPFLRFLVIRCSQALVLLLAAICLAAFAAARLGMSVVFTDNVGTTIFDVPESGAAQDDSPVKATLAPQTVEIEAGVMTPLCGPSSQMHSVEDPDNNVPVQSANGMSIEDRRCSLPLSADSVSFYNSDCIQPPSPLLFAPLHSAAASQIKPSAELSSSGPYSSPPLAMAMLTPAEPPSPFPGFPALSGLGACCSSPESVSQPGPALSSEQLHGEDPIPLAETPKINCKSETENHAGETDEGFSTSPDSNASSWGSGSAATPNVLPVDVPLRMEGTCNEDLDVAQVSAATLPAIMDAPRSPGATPWPGFVWVTANTPTSTSSGGLPSLHASATVAPVFLDDSEAIFDLNRYNEDGEEVSLSSSADGGDDVNASKKVTANQRPRRQVKWRFPSRKPAVHPTPRGSDIRPSDVFSASGSNSSGGAPSGANTDPDKVKALADDLSTPTWPPKLAEEVEGLEEPDVDDVLITEALDLAKSLSTGGQFGPGSNMAQPGSPPSVAQDHAYLTHNRSLHKPCKEPGREYAAVAAAARMWLAKTKSCSRDVLRAACAGNEPALRAAQAELHAAVMQLLDLDLAPHAYTASVGACKTLAFSSANTPVPQELTMKKGGNECESWPSIGSRVASGSAVAACPIANPAGADLPEGAADEVCPQKSSCAMAGMDRDVWPGGPGPLPEDIDAYLASTRSQRPSASEFVVTGFQEHAAFMGLLLNAASSHIFSTQERPKELDALYSGGPALSDTQSTPCKLPVDLELAEPSSAWVCVPTACNPDSASVESGSVTELGLSEDSDASEKYEELQTPVAMSVPQPSEVLNLAGNNVPEVSQELLSSALLGDECGTEPGTPDGMAAADFGFIMDTAQFTCGELGYYSVIRSGAASCEGASTSPQPMSEGAYADSGFSASRVGPVRRMVDFVSMLEEASQSHNASVGVEIAAGPTRPSHDGVKPDSSSTSARPLWRPQV